MYNVVHGCIKVLNVPRGCYIDVERPAYRRIPRAAESRAAAGAAPATGRRGLAAPQSSRPSRRRTRPPGTREPETPRDRGTEYTEAPG